MKTKLTLFALLLSAMCFAQLPLPWTTDGNSVIFGTPRLGTTNNKGFNIITNNQPAVNVANDGTFNFIKPVNFTNAVKFDSLRVIHYIDVDSIHCRTLKVGHSLTTNDAGPAGPVVRPFLQQLFNTSDNKLVLEGGNFASTPAVRDNTKFLIGFLNAGNGPQHKLNIHSNFNNDVFSVFTNINSYAGNIFATDGFKVGILANGIAQLNQQENLPMTFFTGNPVGLSTERMRIVNSTGRVGINNINPLNRLEITSAAGDPGFASINGSSGLKFANLNNSNTPIANPSNKVLGVDAAGNVILVPGGTGGPAVVTAQNGLNTSVASPAVELGGTLLHPTAINHQNNDMFWYNGGKFVIGLNSTYGAVSHKLQVYNDVEDDNISVVHARPSASYANPQNGIEVNNATPNTSASGINNGLATSVSGAKDIKGVQSLAIQSAFVAGTSAVGVNGVAKNGDRTFGAEFIADGQNASAIESKGMAANAQNATNVTGVEAIGSNGTNNNTYGVYVGSTASTGNNYGILSNAAGSAGVSNYGMQSNVSGSQYFNYALYGQAFNLPPSPTAVNIGGVFSAYNGATNYGIFAQAGPISAPGYVSAGPPGPDYAGYFNGDVYIAGQFGPSDQTLKQNIDTIPNALGKIMQLQPKTFDFNQTVHPNMFLPAGTQYGLIAQQVQSVLPALVSTNVHPAKKDSAGNVIYPAFNYLGLEYQQLIPILIKGMQTQQKQILKQDSLIQTLLANNLRSANNPAGSTGTTQTVTATAVELSDKNIISLDNSVPNPWIDNTAINYNIPVAFGYAQIIFSTMDGRIIKTVDIKEKGAGTLNVYAKDLSSGLYSYSLIVDGKTIDTKKMIKQN